MNDMLELSAVSFTDSQNDALSKTFCDFYKIKNDLKIKKKLYATKESYQKIHREKMLARKPFEKMQFDKWTDNSALEIHYSETLFIFPSERTITLTEYLDKPNGITHKVNLYDSDGKFMEFSVYAHAEAEVVSRYNQIFGG